MRIPVDVRTLGISEGAAGAALKCAAGFFEEEGVPAPESVFDLIVLPVTAEKDEKGKLYLVVEVQIKGTDIACTGIEMELQPSQWWSK